MEDVREETEVSAEESGAEPTSDQTEDKTQPSADPLEEKTEDETCTSLVVEQDVDNHGNKVTLCKICAVKYIFTY